MDRRFPLTIESATKAYCYGLEDAADQCTAMIAAAGVCADADWIRALVELRQWCWNEAARARKY